MEKSKLFPYLKIKTDNEGGIIALDIRDGKEICKIKEKEIINMRPMTYIFYCLDKFIINYKE